MKGKIASLESSPSAQGFRGREGIGRRHHQAGNASLPSIFQSPRGRIL